MGVASVLSYPTCFYLGLIQVARQSRSSFTPSCVEWENLKRVANPVIPRFTTNRTVDTCLMVAYLAPSKCVSQSFIYIINIKPQKISRLNLTVLFMHKLFEYQKFVLVHLDFVYKYVEDDKYKLHQTLTQKLLRNVKLCYYFRGHTK